jgi:hypothetical protein
VCGARSRRRGLGAYGGGKHPRRVLGTAARSRAQEAWKIVYFHHPLNSNGTRHGSNVELRVTLEPLLVQYGVNVVFSGHARIYGSDETMRARVP